MLSRLYAITERSLIGSSFEEAIEQAINGGARLIQLREKNISDDMYTGYAKAALAVCRRFNAPLIINDNIDVCIAAGADGVHLGQGDESPEKARQMLGKNAIIGVTAKTIEQAKLAESCGADYIGSGAVFGTETKSDAKKMDLDTLRSIAAAVSIPVYAIGGINTGNVSQLYGSGIYGIAVVSGIFKGDIKSNAQALKKAAKRL